MGKTVNNLVDIIRDIIQEEISKEDDIVLCQVDQKKDKYHYDVVLASDPNTVIRNITNTTPYDLSKGDYVYTYKIKNQLSNAFIMDKVIPYINNKTITTGSKIKEYIYYASMGYTVNGSTEYGISCSDGSNLLGYSED